MWNLIDQVPGVAKDEGREEDSEKKQGNLPESKTHGCFLGRGGWWVIGDCWLLILMVEVVIFGKVIMLVLKVVRRLRTEWTNMSLKAFHQSFLSALTGALYLSSFSLSPMPECHDSWIFNSHSRQTNKQTNWQPQQHRGSKYRVIFFHWYPP